VAEFYFDGFVSRVADEQFQRHALAGAKLCFVDDESDAQIDAIPADSSRLAAWLDALTSFSAYLRGNRRTSLGVSGL